MDYTLDYTYNDDYTAIGIAEGFIEADTQEYIAAWQHLVDTGLAWQLQGWFGRTAAGLIHAGYVKRPSEMNKD